MKNRSIFDSFNNALDGVIHGLKNERNLKIHFLAAFIVLIFSLFYDFNQSEFLIIIFAISLVIVSELFNTSIEAVVDLVCKDEYHELAKIAKDTAAGAVFLSAINAVIVAFVLFFRRLGTETIVFDKIKAYPVYITIISLIIVFIITIVLKTMTGKKNRLLSGGMPSGHSAISFSIATAIGFLTNNLLIIVLAYILALLVSQSRIEGKIHSYIQVLCGALIGTLITIIIFQVFL